MVPREVLGDNRQAFGVGEGTALRGLQFSPCRPWLEGTHRARSDGPIRGWPDNPRPSTAEPSERRRSKMEDPDPRRMGDGIGTADGVKFVQQ